MSFSYTFILQIRIVTFFNLVIFVSEIIALTKMKRVNAIVLEVVLPALFISLPY